MLVCLPRSILHGLCYTVFLKSLASKDSIISASLINGFQSGLQWKTLQNPKEGGERLRYLTLFPCTSALTLYSYCSSVFSFFHGLQNYCFLLVILWSLFPSVYNLCKHRPPFCHPVNASVNSLFIPDSLGWILFPVANSDTSYVIPRLQGLFCAPPLRLQN